MIGGVTMDKNTIHDLAVVYAEVKLKEYQLVSKTAPMEENTEFSIDEVQYLKSAYNFAIQHLSE